MEGDVVVCSDHADAKKLVIGLAHRINDLRGVGRWQPGQRQVRRADNPDVGEHQPYLQSAFHHQDSWDMTPYVVTVQS